ATLPDRRAHGLRAARLDQRDRARAAPDARFPLRRLSAGGSRPPARGDARALRALDARRRDDPAPLVPALASSLRAPAPPHRGEPVVARTAGRQAGVAARSRRAAR